MSLLSDLKILYHMAVHPIRGQTHKERLESFYSGQADGYDDFRRRLLKGREGLYRKLGQQSPQRWADLGGGTGANLEFIGEPIRRIESLHLVDLSGSLLSVAKERARARGWGNVHPVEADVTTWLPPTGPASLDVVTFSYSLTMIPDWFAAIDHARTLLKPGGLIGVVDFYVSRKHPAPPRKRHSWLTRTFWPTWFAMDNVFPNPDHIPYLSTRFRPLMLKELRGSVPYMPGSQMPYYQFIGRKESTP